MNQDIQEPNQTPTDPKNFTPVEPEEASSADSTTIAHEALAPITTPSSEDANHVQPVPAAAQTGTTPPDAGPAAQKKKSSFKLMWAVSLLIFIILLAAAFFVGRQSTPKSSNTASVASNSMTAAAVPAGATILQQCEPGLGAQYILPKDIPNGPIYNVYKGKLTGIEYMVNLSSLQGANSLVSNLRLEGYSYDHMNIMSMPAHAGFPRPHYEIDVMMVPNSFTNTITCGTGSSQPSMSMSMGM